MLLWFWPENRRFDFRDCTTFFNIDGCQLTDDRSLYNKADGVLIFHKSIKHDLSNLPPSPRPPFQKWIWYHVESPTNTIRIPGLENLFNLTLSYREDADIPDKLVCWIVSNNNPATGTAVRDNYYRELVKHIKVDVFGKAFARFLRYEDYYSTLSSSLAEFLLKLDKDDEAYLRYFQWRRNLFAQQHLIQLSQEFIQSICYACDHIGKHKEYRVVHDLYKWYLV
ncbi:unnamed protein product [Oncorhynchus mykiss]|uniref:Fucosyltransferase n=1 Tax=Oncorhynchus mykiss TaxID=8022 RepID=A0A060X3J2_ONCMY|nr:unnamed protein product [Oncorhynchus mykiss]